MKTWTVDEIAEDFQTCMDPASTAEGPLCLCYMEHEGILFLNNAVAATCAANFGLPACMAKDEWVDFIANSRTTELIMTNGAEFMIDDYVPHPVGDLFLDAAKKVLSL